MNTVLYTGLYLFAIVAANLLAARFGASMSIINSFLFIGLDLTSRDKLHEAWHKNGLVWKMLLIISSGSLISWFLNKDAGQVAVASFAAFACAAIIDTVAYQLLFKRAKFVKINGSNLFSAMADSIIFPTIAFGGFTLWITLAQFATKVLGGFVWSLVLSRQPTPHGADSLNAGSNSRQS